MKKRNYFVFTLVYLVYFFSCTGCSEYPKIERKPEPLDFMRGELKKFTQYDPVKKDPWQMDLRHYDLSNLDLKHQFPSLIHSTFDTRTIWPPAKNMPDDFEYDKILKLGKDPGLGIRKLHSRGITGESIGIAIIDQPLLVQHKEYKKRLLYYTEINIDPSGCAQMHGPAVSSVLAGKSTGVAPGIDLYYIATMPGKWSNKKRGFEYDLNYLADALKKIMMLNRKLSSERKIRAVAIQLGWDISQKGFTQLSEAVTRATKEGIFVISCSLFLTHGYKFHGLGREPLSDPDLVDSYTPGSWWKDMFYRRGLDKDRLLIPMDSRTLACASGPREYAFYREGGWSWVVPYIAGLYALSCQVKKDITPDEFWKTALSTASFTQIKKGDITYPLGPIINPAAMIDSLLNQ